MKDLLIEKLYEISKKPYQKFFKKNQPWNISQQEFLHYPEETLGFHLGCFLLKHNFDIQPKLEDHDVVHVLTNTGISVPEEIGMQYLLFGNGKRSLYLYMVMLTGTFFIQPKSIISNSKCIVVKTPCSFIISIIQKCFWFP
ncbi:ubiquinone biosynthesis protein COQ4 [Flavobacterium macacae]|uniref:ubiquinone biosynthesis protein COQ4 n=1 Tax=Flavobacterium macacae TaxID=2488993 RepID=UPI001F15A099|nr:ubiquinone biosynthesis protein COQ4 [Flavobacterium macacae]